MFGLSDFVIYLSRLSGYDVPIVEMHVVVHLVRTGNHTLYSVSQLFDVPAGEIVTVGCYRYL